MSENNKEFQNPRSDSDVEERLNDRGGSNQYGKKGRKPRRNYERPRFDLDSIHTNNPIYWNGSTGFNDVSKFAWNLIVSNPKSVQSTISYGLYPKSNSAILNPPAVMAIDVVMGPGWASSPSDGVNRGLAQTMAKIRSVLSTSNIGFETADLGIYLAATSSIAALIGVAKRTLESIRVWKDRNIAYPRALCRAMNMDYDEIVESYPTFCWKLHSVIDRYNNMSIPDFAWCYDRQYALMHNIFADEDSQLGQLYLFRPANCYEYVDDGETGAYAKSIDLTSWYSESSTISLGRLLDLIGHLLDSWYSSSDLYQINGVLLRAFKDAPRQVMPDFDNADKIEPVVDRSHLMQIMNCSIVGQLDHTTLDITQDPTTQNYVIWTPSSTLHSGDYSKTQHVLRLFEDDISQEDNMELTRLLNLWKEEGNPVDGFSCSYTNCGSEIVTEIEVLQYDATTDEISAISFNGNDIFIDTSNSAGLLVNLKRLAFISPFRYIPCFNLLWTDGDLSTRYEGILGDMYNWMIYDIEDWNSLQYQAYWSLWKPRLTE